MRPVVLLGVLQLTFRSRNCKTEVSLTKDPIPSLKKLSEWGMGFLDKGLESIQRIHKNEPEGSGKIKAVEISPSHLIVIAVEKKGGQIEISNFRIEPRPKSEEAVSERLKTIFSEEGLSPKEVRTSLKNTGMVIRILSFPQMKRSEIASMLQFEVEKYIPFKASEIMMDFDILEESVAGVDAKMLEIILVAVKQNEVRELCGIFQNAGIGLELVGVAALAFVNAIEFAFPETKQSTLGFLDLGTENATFGVTSHGKPVFIRDISFGSADILKVIRRKLGAEADKIQPGSSEYKSALEQALDNLINEIKLSLGYSMERIAGAKAMEMLFVTGGGFRYVPSLNYLEQQLKVPMRKPELTEKIKTHTRVDPNLIQTNQDLLVPILGLCL